MTNSSASSVHRNTDAIRKRFFFVAKVFILPLARRENLHFFLQVRRMGIPWGRGRPVQGYLFLSSFRKYNMNYGIIGNTICCRL